MNKDDKVCLCWT